MTEPKSLRSRLLRPPIVVAPGVYDALTALIATQAGFEALYVTAPASPTRVSVGRISGWSACETGYGNALNVERAVRLLERAGANALQIEDQDFPMRCGHLDDKWMISAPEMVGKIKAALDARRSPETLIVARIDAVAVEGFERAIERAVLYREAGADMLFVEAPKTLEQLGRVAAALDGAAPMMANMVEGGKTPMQPASDLEQLGFSLVIFPGGIVRALAKTEGEFYASLAEGGTTEPFRPRMFDFDALDRLIGTPEMLERAKRYDGSEPTLSNKAGRDR